MHIQPSTSLVERVKQEVHLAEAAIVVDTEVAKHTELADATVTLFDQLECKRKDIHYRTSFFEDRSMELEGMVGGYALERRGTAASDTAHYVALICCRKTVAGGEQFVEASEPLGGRNRYAAISKSVALQDRTNGIYRQSSGLAEKSPFTDIGRPIGSDKEIFQQYLYIVSHIGKAAGIAIDLTKNGITS